MEPDFLELTLRNLTDPNPDIRKGAAFWLGEAMDARAVNPLIEALNDRDADVRAYAANALGFLKDSRAVEPLLEKLSDDDVYVRAASIAALTQLADKRAIPILENIVDSDLSLRANAITALGEFGVASIGNKAVNFLEDDHQTEDVYQACIVTIGKLRQENGIKAIEKFLRRNDLGLVNSALIALANIGTQSTRSVIENNLAHLNGLDREVALRILEGKFTEPKP